MRGVSWRPIIEAALLLIGLVWTLWYLAGLAKAESMLGHDRNHATYQSWVNGESKGCCNDADCHGIADEDVRTVQGHLEVYIRGVGIATGQAMWCPVLTRHYLTHGNAPDGSSHHACVTGFYGGQTPCAQFICYQPPAGG